MWQRRRLGIVLAALGGGLAAACVPADGALHHGIACEGRAVEGAQIEYELDSVAVRLATRLEVSVVLADGTDQGVDLVLSDSRMRAGGALPSQHCRVRGAGLAGQGSLRLASAEPVTISVHHADTIVAGPIAVQPGAKNVFLEWSRPR